MPCLIYLYPQRFHPLDIWIFTVVWSIIFALVVYLPAGKHHGSKNKYRDISSNVIDLLLLCRHVGIYHFGQNKDISMVHLDDSSFHIRARRITRIICNRKHHRQVLSLQRGDGGGDYHLNANNHATMHMIIMLHRRGTGSHL